MGIPRVYLAIVLAYLATVHMFVPSLAPSRSPSASATSPSLPGQAPTHTLVSPNCARVRAGHRALTWYDRRTCAPTAHGGPGRPNAVFRPLAEDEEVQQSTGPAATLEYDEFYRGCSSFPVAVKWQKNMGSEGHREWMAEINYRKRLSHPNLVKFIGYCFEDQKHFLVYEYMPKGSLDVHLFRRGLHFQWSVRMKVALGAARGLAFLHGDQANVIYRDFKASNVLLDSEFNAKLNYFGLARDGPCGDTSHVSTRVLGTYGYAAPEYLATGHLTMKCDVYSYGVLLELLTGLRAIDHNRPPGQHNLVDWARPYINHKKRFTRVLDPRLGSQYPPHAAFKIANLAWKCLLVDARRRPSMDNVVFVLEGLLKCDG